MRRSIVILTLLMTCGCSPLAMLPSIGATIAASAAGSKLGATETATYNVDNRTENVYVQANYKICLFKISKPYKTKYKKADPPDIIRSKSLDMYSRWPYTERTEAEWDELYERTMSRWLREYEITSISYPGSEKVIRIKMHRRQ